MRHTLMSSVFRGPVYASDMGASNGGGPSGFWPFNKGKPPQQQTQNRQQNNQQQQPGNNQNNQNNQNQNQNQNNADGGDENDTGDNDQGDDNFETFLANNKDLWQDDEAGNEITPEQQAAREAADVKRRDSLKNYISSQQFGLKIDPTKLKEALDSNNPEYLQNLFNEAGQRVFAKMLDDVTKMMTSTENKFRDMVTNISQTQMSARESEISLMMALPMAKSPAIKPVAMAFKSRFMKKGQSDEEANESVTKMFNSIRKAPAESLGLEEETELETRPPNGRRARVTSSKGGVKLVNGEPEDWGKFLSGE